MSVLLRHSLFWIFLIGFISISAILNGLNSPSLCRKCGIVLHCPCVKEPPSLWGNPFSATTHWKPCVERRNGGISDIPPENETSGYIFIHAAGWSIEKRKRNSRPHEESVYKSLEERLIREFPKAWRLYGENLFADRCNLVQENDAKEWTDINQFWSNLSNVLTYIDKKINEQKLILHRLIDGVC